MVMEAVAVKVRREDAKAEKEAQRRAWHSTRNKANFDKLENYR
jgi:hypothetical protein